MEVGAKCVGAEEMIMEVADWEWRWREGDTVHHTYGRLEDRERNCGEEERQRWREEEESEMDGWNRFIHRRVSDK